MRKLIICIALLTVVSQAQWTDVFKKQQSASTLGNDKIAAGLKEALQVSTANAVAITGKTDGYNKNGLIHIPLPPKLQTVKKGMAMLGAGKQLDDLELGMNRAAEMAAPKAKAIFLSALQKMSFNDARAILQGNDTAATDYFKRTCTADLTREFTPIVKQSMDKLSIVQQYNDVVRRTPGAGALAGNFDVNQYVVGKALDGLFLMLGKEEEKIRKNPAAQTTTLLKQVFGKK